MNELLSGKRIAILVADGFEQSELTSAQSALERAGARTYIVSPERGEVRGWGQDRFEDSLSVDLGVEEAAVRDFEALLLPGGALSPDILRQSEASVRFVRAFVHAGKPVAAICHALQTMVAARVVRNRTLTSYPSVRMDLVRAGANWVDAAVVVDRGLVTSRSNDDLDEFNARMIEEFSRGGRGPVIEGQAAVRG